MTHIIRNPLLLILGLMLFQLHVRAQQPDEKLNFIIIFTDDLGYGDLSSYGHPTIHTPNLDQMAEEGQKWTNFYVGASVCTPSRAALLTGRLPVRSGLASNRTRVFFPDSHNGIPSSEITLAEQMKAAGYATACIGKWHLGHKEEYLPTNHGFDYYFGIPYSNDMDRIIEVTSMQGYMDFWKSEERHNTKNFNVPLLRNTEIIERPADQNTITRRYTDESIAFIRENRDKPFFLYLAHNLPHVPLFASEEFLGKSKRGLYGDVLEEIDHGVGRILQTLRETGLDGNTIVVFTSDNGPWLMMQQESGSAGLLRGGKGSTWEGGMRVPGIFWGPGRVQPKVVTDVGTTMDIFVTFSKLAGVPIPDDRMIDGKDLRPVLFEGENSSTAEVFYYRGQDLFAIRIGDFKAHFITQSGYARDRTEHDPPLLYNLAVDPSEKFNIAEEHPEIIEKIMEMADLHNRNMVKGTDLLEARGE